MFSFRRCVLLAAMLLLTCPAWATISLVQHGSNLNGSGSSVSVTLNGVTSGNALIVGLACGYTPPHTPVSVSSSPSNTWTTGVSNLVSGATQAAILSAANVASGNTVITGSCTGAGAASIHAVEVSGLQTSSILDQIASTAGTTGTTLDSGNTPTTTVANEFLFGMFSTDDGALTVGSGYTDLDHTTFIAADEYKIVSATGTYNATMTQPSSTHWVAEIATYKGAAAAKKRLPLLGVGD